MKKVLSLVLCSIILFTCSLGLSGCVFNRENLFPYRGEYKELYTTAIYSIPDAEGYMHHGEGAHNSDIYIWEQDDYGRTLFSYCEDFHNTCRFRDLHDLHMYTSDPCNSHFHKLLHLKTELLHSK